MILFPIVRIVYTPDRSELATVAHCIRQHADREQAFLVDMARYVPDEQLLQWRTLLHESAFVAAWMRDLDEDAETLGAAA